VLHTALLLLLLQTRCVGDPGYGALLQKVRLEKLLLLHRLNLPSTLVITTADPLPMQLLYRSHRLGTIVCGWATSAAAQLPLHGELPDAALYASALPGCWQGWGSCEEQEEKGQRCPRPRRNRKLALGDVIHTNLMPVQFSVACTLLRWSAAWRRWPGV
jgi:hypothetical protein